MAGVDYHKQAQSYYADAPLIILGSGASMDFGLPSMGQLAVHLKSSVDTSRIPDDDAGEWGKFCEHLDSGADLEAALQRVNFSDDTTNIIVRAVWENIYAADESVFLRSVSDHSLFPLGVLLSHMLRSSLNQIDIVTTNYDCIAEYACDQERLFHYTGFSHGYTRRIQDQNQVTSARAVNIWKVHGSIDWFVTPGGENIAVSKSHTELTDMNPQIVTPGFQKYQKTNLEPYRSVITNADSAMLKANSYLCVGYGFNDEHIQPKMLEKCEKDNASIIVITYALTEQAKSLLFGGKISNYIAIERGADDSKSVIHSSHSSAPQTVDEDYWTLQGFLKMIT